MTRPSPLPAPPEPPEGGGPPRAPRPRFSSGFRTARDLISFVVGLAIIGYEVFVATRIDILGIGIGGALLGLPVFFGADERRRNDQAGSE